MIYRDQCCARIGLVGNPSDGYNGKTIAVAIRNFWAEATVYESPRVELRPAGSAFVDALDAEHGRQAELDAAIDAGAEVIGVNNRDLAKLEVDLATFERLAPDAPDDVTLIAESGVATVEDVRRMREAGAEGLLIGGAIMDGDPQTNTERLTGAAY